MSIAAEIGLLGALRNRLATLWDQPAVEVSRIEPFGDGHSGDTFTIDVVAPGRSGRHVLRLCPAGVPIKGPADIGRQGRIMSALFEKGCPAPEVLAYDSSGAVVGRAFALMRVVEGVPWSRVAARSGHTAVVSAAIAALRALQPVTSPLSGEQPLDELDRWVPLLERSPASIHAPAIELRDALRVNPPGPAEPVLVHGDFHYGNLLFGDTDEVVAVLDWEIASLGHPLTDLSCLAVASLRRRYAPDPNPTGDLDISLTDLIARYGADATEASWHIAAACHKYSAIIGYNLHLHRRGKRHDPLYEQLEGTMHRLLEDGRTILTGGLGAF